MSSRKHTERQRRTCTQNVQDMNEHHVVNVTAIMAANFPSARLHNESFISGGGVSLEYGAPGSACTFSR